MEDMQLLLNNANIFIFSDCVKNFEALTKILKQKSYNNIKNTSNYDLAVNYVKENIQDIILIDISENDKIGYKICKILKTDKELREIPIIFICSKENNDKEELFSVGGVDYICSCFNELEVVVKIEMHLKLRFMELQLEKIKNENSNSISELQRTNEELINLNKVLKKEVSEKNQQFEEIALELKEFNVVLEEEITERTKTEEALKESERQFRYSLEEAPLPIMLYTEDGNIKTINRTWVEITGYTIKDMSTISKWAEVSEIFKLDLADNNIKKLSTSKKRQNDGEYIVKTRKSNIRFWNFYSAYIGELQDGHKLFMRVAIDITERKNIEELRRSVEDERKKLYEIKEYDRIKTEFFSNISHELRTPINLIFSALQMHDLKLKKCSFPDESIDKYKYTKIMKQNCYRLLRLINNIIDITKIDSGYFDICEQNVDIISLIENIVISVADYVESKGLSLIFDTDVEEKVIACDLEKMERIILNLLSNAVKFTPNGGTILVNVQDIGENISICIKDTGRGIPKDKLNTIFERFIQVDKSLTRDHEGSGIGLSLVKSLVELQGGTILVKSHINEGTEFIIQIPCKLVDEVEEEFSFCDSIGKNYIEKINIEFSDIYK
ncbi:PAS domain S-box protein [Clostridium chromiireducens]|uniref:Stage 0 sporulation protein A homolog n=1 Tax=Clostridium chromiireducens TaxID=225345 RepID=A0A399IM70_9CLOT|nr:ATP-binding protein [Clostridium chromiireducens]RII33359.1 PAS domain S-box protein [Clostridium chromiireducens]